MRRLAAVALVFAGLSLSAHGQRHAAAVHSGGFPAHPAPAPRSGFGAPSAPRFSGPTRSFGPSSAPRFAGPARNFGAQRFASRPSAPGGEFHRGGPRVPVGRIGDHRDGHHRRVYISSYYAPGYPYPYGAWLVPGFPTVLDYNDEGDDSQAQQGPVNPGYADQGNADNGGYDDQQNWSQDSDGQYLGPWPSAPPSGAAGANSQLQSSPPLTDSGIILIFKDGRAPLHAHNYVLTQNSIFVGDARGVTIPISQLDLDATAKANRDAGVDFQIPEPAN